MYIELNKCIHI